MQQIANSKLRIDDVPEPEADWWTIGDFALTFNGYEFWGSDTKCAEIAEARRGSTLTDLRTCLFYEQRRWHHHGCDPDTETMVYIRDLVGRIREMIIRGDRQ